MQQHKECWQESVVWCMQPCQYTSGYDTADKSASSDTTKTQQAKPRQNKLACVCSIRYGDTGSFSGNSGVVAAIGFDSKYFKPSCECTLKCSSSVQT